MKNKLLKKLPRKLLKFLADDLDVTRPPPHPMQDLASLPCGYKVLKIKAFHTRYCISREGAAEPK